MEQSYPLIARIHGVDVVIGRLEHGDDGELQAVTAVDGMRLAAETIASAGGEDREGWAFNPDAR